MTPVLKVSQLTRYFNELRAVNGIDFEIEEGTCLGLLGPNGAGKTTTVEMLEGIQAPDSGQVLFRGRPLDAKFRNLAGVMFQSTSLQDYITVVEALQLFQRLYPRAADLQQIIRDCALEEFLHQDTASLSGGQRQRLLLAIALVNDPQILFLDEPTTGLDPQARHNFWDLIDKIKGQNKTIVLTTHYMEEAWRLCDKIIIMDHGEIIAEGTPVDLLSQHFNDVVLSIPASPELDRLLNSEHKGRLDIIHQPGRVEIISADINHTVQQLQASGVSLEGLQIRQRTLDDLFLQLTGRTLRQ